jgi:hypothetical protein
LDEPTHTDTASEADAAGGDTRNPLRRVYRRSVPTARRRLEPRGRRSSGHRKSLFGRPTHATNFLQRGRQRRERVMQAILDAYAEPDRSFDELRQTRLSGVGTVGCWCEMNNKCWAGCHCSCGRCRCDMSVHHASKLFMMPTMWLSWCGVQQE